MTTSFRAPGLMLAAAVLLALCACRSAQPPAQATRAPVEKPWTKESVEPHEFLWLELSTGKHGIMTGPVVASDEKGEYLTTKDDPTVHLALSDVLVMDALTFPAEAAGGVPAQAEGGVTVQSVGGSVFALWTVVLFFIPAILLIAVLG